MYNKKALNWLHHKSLQLEKSFSYTIKMFAQDYKIKHGIRNIEEVYSMLEIKKQYLSYWEQKSYTIQSKKKLL